MSRGVTNDVKPQSKRLERKPFVAVRTWDVRSAAGVGGGGRGGGADKPADPPAPVVAPWSEPNCCRGEEPAVTRVDSSTTEGRGSAGTSALILPPHSGQNAASCAAMAPQFGQRTVPAMSRHVPSVA